MATLPAGVEIRAGPTSGSDEVLTLEALAFVAMLHRTFNHQRIELLERRHDRQKELDGGAMLDFPAATADVRAGDWRIAPAPADLADRRVEITGPAEPKMMINALNSGAQVFMADLEDALSPTWSNVLAAHAALRDAAQRRLTFTSPEGKDYTLGERIATLVVRPRGWHLVERHVLVDGVPISASLLDFGLHLFHNGREALERGSGPYFYLPKLEGRWEARLWNEVFVAGQEALGIPRGSIRATVLVETIHAAFEMDEILHELREHAAGLNAGRWDYIFSLIKTFHDRPDMVLPDRAMVTMAVPFMRAYTQLLVRTCHRRGAHAIGGMAAFIPDRRQPEVTETALAKVREDKRREAGDGFDGTWVAHPDLVPVASEIFSAALGDRVDQKHLLREDVSVAAADLLDVRIHRGQVTAAGYSGNIGVALQYLSAWLTGTGAAAINDLMEDAATAEIARSQLWHWNRHLVPLDDGRMASPDLYRAVRAQEVSRLGGRAASPRLDDAAALLDGLVLSEDFPEFLTLPAYPYLD